jgi:hypothetical protein
MTSDSYCTSDSEFVDLRSKVTDNGQFLIGTTGDARLRSYLATHVRRGESVKRPDFDCANSSALLFDNTMNHLLLLTVTADDFRLYELNHEQYYAIGYGASVVMVLSDLGYDDAAIGEALVKRIAFVAAPFHTMDA